jgi:hypothetical protein
MARQLDILALEPFYGGARKAMIETILRYSRHRWTVLRLPPRRIERRLAAAAHWFAEQLSRHWVGRADVLFTSEAMNLGDLVRLFPPLASKPRVVYFHDNQLPAIGQRAESPLHLVNLSTAAAATEVWFNSLYHLRTFLTKASSLVERHPELSGRNPLPELTGKAQLMPPPVDLPLDRDILERLKPQRNPRQIFVDTRDADIELLNRSLSMLTQSGEQYSLVTVGPLNGLQDDLPRTTISERDEDAQIMALHQAMVLVSARPGAASDHYAVRALHLGCWPVFPDTGVYPELLPRAFHEHCLYEGRSAERLCAMLRDAWELERPGNLRQELGPILTQFDALQACHAIDERLDHLASESIRAIMGK